MQKELKNHAYIDANNLHKGINSLGWKLDYKKFRKFLTERYGVKKAYLCIGFIAENAGLYRDLQNCGYTLIFKPTVPYKAKIKGNCEKFFVISSDNDPYIPLEINKELARLVNAELKIIHNGGHLNKKAGYGKFPELLDFISKIGQPLKTTLKF